MEQNKPVIGIDFGNAKFSVGFWDQKKIQTLGLDSDPNPIPAFISFAEKRRLFFSKAFLYSNYNNCNTVFGLQSIMSLKYFDIRVQNQAQLCPFSFYSTLEGNPLIAVQEKNDTIQQYTIQQLLSMMFSKIQIKCETFLKNQVEDAVISVPAYFTDTQRISTKEACAIAGIKVKRLMPDHIATAMAARYLNPNLFENYQNILIFDIGALVTNVALISVDDDIFETLGLIGQCGFGGDAITEHLMEYFADQYMKTKKQDLLADKRALMRLRNECERAKQILSTSDQTIIEFQNMQQDFQDFSFLLTLSAYQQICRPLFDKYLQYLKTFFKIYSKYQKEESVDQVFLTGGTNRIPQLQKLIEGFFPQIQINTSLLDKEPVMIGSVLQSAILSNQAQNEFRNFIFLDMTAYSYGIEVYGKELMVWIPKDAYYPVENSQLFTSKYDSRGNGEKIFQIFAGEQQLTKDCLKIAEFCIDNTPPSFKGPVQNKITIYLDDDAIISVKAFDEVNQITQIGLQLNRCRFSKDAIQHFRKDCIFREQSDASETQRENVSLQLDRLIQTLYNTLIMNQDRINIDNYNQIKLIIQEKREWLIDNEFTDADSYIRQYNDLEKYWNQYLNIPIKLQPI